MTALSSSGKYTCFCGKTYGPYKGAKSAYKRHLKTKHGGDPRAQSAITQLGGRKRKPSKKASRPRGPSEPKVPDILDAKEDVFEIPSATEKVRRVRKPPSPKGAPSWVTMTGKDGEKRVVPIKQREQKGRVHRRQYLPVPNIFDRTSNYQRVTESSIPLESSPRARVLADAGKPLGKARAYTRRELLRYGKVPIPSSGPIGLNYEGESAGHADLIYWDHIKANALEAMPPAKHYRDNFVDFPHADTSEGLIFELRDAFARNRVSVCQGKKPINVGLQGLPGTGKSVSIRAFAAEVGLPYFYVSADPEIMGKEQLLGSHILRSEAEGGGSAWRDGTILKCARYGGVLHIDEMSLLDPEVTAVLHSMTDSSRSINLMSENGEIVRLHPDCFVTVTLNPEEQGTLGVKGISEPMRRRFQWITVDYPPLKNELEIIKTQCKLKDKDFKIPNNPQIEDGTGKYGDDITKAMRAIQEIRQMYREEQAVRFVPTISEAIDFCNLLQSGRDVNSSLHLAFVGKYLGEEREKVEDAVRKQWGTRYKADLRS